MGSKSSKKSQNEPNKLKQLRAEQRKFIEKRDELLGVIVVKPHVLPKTCTPPPSNTTRFVVISDTHCRTSEMSKLPEGDVLIHAGDFLDNGTPKEVIQFEAFLREQPHSHKIVIAGNHDKPFLKEMRTKATSKEIQIYETAYQSFVRGQSCVLLENSEVTINGIKIFGLPWAYDGIETLNETYDQIVPGVDIIISHSPPLGYGDIISDGPGGPAHLGQTTLLQAVMKVAPKYHLFGHLHEAYGIYTNDKTVFINASTCTKSLEATNPPIVFDVPNKN